MQIENQVRSVTSIQNSSVLKSTYRTATTDETIGTTMKLVILTATLSIQYPNYLIFFRPNLIGNFIQYFYLTYVNF